MKNLSKSTRLLIIILSFMVLFEIKKEVGGERNFFLKRWFGNNYSYAKNLEIEFFQLSNAQVADMFANPHKKIAQPSLEEISNNPINGVVRIKNHGELTIKGRLRNEFFQTDVGPIPGCHKNSESNYYCIVFPYQLSSREKNNPDLFKPLDFTWHYLYTE